MGKLGLGCSFRLCNAVALAAAILPFHVLSRLVLVGGNGFLCLVSSSMGAMVGSWAPGLSQRLGL
jgi:hypothetical protein